MRGMTYMGSGDPARMRTDYYPAWLDDLADDVTYARTLYEHQAFNFAGPYGDDGFLEDYTVHVRGGQPVGVVVLGTRNAAGEAQHIVVNHRPRNSLLLFSHLMGEKSGGERFVASEPTAR
jgi:hypothetical protein